MAPSQHGLLIPDWSAPSNVVARVSTRLGGVSQGPYESFNIGLHVGDESRDVQVNRRTLVSALDAGLQLRWLDQVHGSQVVRAENAQPSTPGDALVTRQAGLACCITTADCLPVLLTDRQGSVVAAAHGGWRGLAAGVLEATVKAMGVEPGECLAWLGPAIGPCHFEVGPEVRAAFLANTGMVPAAMLEACFTAGTHDNKYMANLYELARIKLSALGVSWVGGGGYCTFCDSQRFYSYRRQPVTGRFVSLIYRKG
ncbi:MAG: peptidoglycan editing factor PgeF [Pseudomonadota bacterium]|jgi:YfiH family protein